jgi:hypothetical protein
VTKQILPVASQTGEIKQVERLFRRQNKPHCKPESKCIYSFLGVFVSMLKQSTRQEKKDETKDFKYFDSISNSEENYQQE